MTVFALPTFPRDVRSYTIPLSNDGANVTWAELSVPAAMTADEWEGLLEIIGMYRRGLVVE